MNERMNFIILLLVGVLMMMAGATRKSSSAGVSLSRAIVRGEEGIDEDPNVKIVYKYLPADVDTFYRLGVHNKPSDLYQPIFNENEMELIR